MSWTKEFFKSSVGKKVIMSLTGLFLCLFMISHLAGNMLLYMNDGGLTYNAFSHFMAHNPVIRIIEVILFFSIIFHVVYAIILTRKNRQARGTRYAVFDGSASSSWFSRSMTFFGLVILIFLVLHIANFFIKARFGTLALDANGHDDLYTYVVESFATGWYAAFYFIAMVMLCFHLVHGVQSAFRTLGMRHKKYLPVVKFLGLAFAVLFPMAFASMPAYFYLTSIL